MFINIEKAIIDGEEIEREQISFWEVMDQLSKQVDTLKLDPKDDVIGRDSEDFEKEYPIKNEDDLCDYLFSNYRYHHHTKKRKAQFRIGKSVLFLTFT